MVLILQELQAIRPIQPFQEPLLNLDIKPIRLELVDGGIQSLLKVVQVIIVFVTLTLINLALPQVQQLIPVIP